MKVSSPPQETTEYRCSEQHVFRHETLGWFCKPGQQNGLPANKPVREGCWQLSVFGRGLHLVDDPFLDILATCYIICPPQFQTLDWPVLKRACQNLLFQIKHATWKEFVLGTLGRNLGFALWFECSQVSNPINNPVTAQQLPRAQASKCGSCTPATAK